MILNSHESLTNYYVTNFNIMYRLDKTNFNPIQWESQITPFERRVYLELLMQELDKEKQKQAAEMPDLLKDPTREEYET